MAPYNASRKLLRYLFVILSKVKVFRMNKPRDFRCSRGYIGEAAETISEIRNFRLVYERVCEGIVRGRSILCRHKKGFWMRMEGHCGRSAG